MMPQKCGNPKCSRSTGIHEGLTFGHGKLDKNGYWQFPCEICARDWDERLPETRKKFKEENPNKNLEHHEWLSWEGWPFKSFSLGADFNPVL